MARAVQHSGHICSMLTSIVCFIVCVNVTFSSSSFFVCFVFTNWVRKLGDKMSLIEGSILNTSNIQCPVSQSALAKDQNFDVIGMLEICKMPCHVGYKSHTKWLCCSSGN